MIELVTVMVIIGALAVFVVPRLNPSGFERYAFRNELLAAVRYAQKTAMASGCDVAVRLDASADRYEVLVRANATEIDECGDGGFTEALRHPAAGGVYAGTAPAGVNITPNQPGYLVFDGFGAHAGGPTTIGFAGGGSIRIDDVTGYITG